MAKTNERVFIRNARLSYPALDKPRASSFDAAGADPKYQATFLMEPSNPSVQAIWAAVQKVAAAEFGDKAAAVLKTADKVPLRRGDDKESVPDGYANVADLTGGLGFLQGGQSAVGTADLFQLLGRAVVDLVEVDVVGAQILQADVYILGHAGLIAGHGLGGQNKPLPASLQSGTQILLGHSVASGGVEIVHAELLQRIHHRHGIGGVTTLDGFRYTKSR